MVVETLCWVLDFWHRFAFDWLALACASAICTCAMLSLHGSRYAIIMEIVVMGLVLAVVMDMAIVTHLRSVHMFLPIHIVYLKYALLVH